MIYRALPHYVTIVVLLPYLKQRSPVFPLITFVPEFTNVRIYNSLFKDASRSDVRISASTFEILVSQFSHKPTESQTDQLYFFSYIFINQLCRMLAEASLFKHHKRLSRRAWSNARVDAHRRGFTTLRQVAYFAKYRYLGGVRSFRNPRKPYGS